MERRMLNRLCALVLLVSCGATASLAAPVADETVAKLVKQLESVDSDERAAAAKSLREILKDDPTRRSNDHGRAYWEEQVARVREGMTHHGVVKHLPSADGAPSTWMLCSGRSCQYGWRLDDYWTIGVVYQRRDDTPAVEKENWLEGPAASYVVASQPTLKESAVQQSPERPKSYNGIWSTWYVNGQPYAEIECVNGKTHGESRHFFDNGVLSSTQEYMNGVAHGVGRGWGREGERLYEIAYANGKQSGTHTRWWPDGKLHSLGEYRDGKLEGPHQRWHESGLLASDEHYRNGKRHGESKSWNEEGKVNWSRQYRDDEVVERR
jgi:antitoxin component YwqK of YwqJK toxin-antitoxin module